MAMDMKKKMPGMGKQMYPRLAIMLVLSFIAMYVLMYAMVNIAENALPSFNQLYMAGLMTAPMAVLEIALMGGMYPDKRLNGAILIGGVLLLGLCWVAIRQQAGIGDRQFLRSMVPHHAGAILMCNEAKLSDPEVKALCAAIVTSQQGEIDLMKAKLKSLEAQ